MNKTRRLFVGIPLSPQLKKRLVRESERFPKEAVLLTRPENLHVTVFFLGFVQTLLSTFLNCNHYKILLSISRYFQVLQNYSL